MLEAIYFSVAVIGTLLWLMMTMAVVSTWFIYGGKEEAREALLWIFVGPVAVVLWPLSVLVGVGFIARDAFGGS